MQDTRKKIIALVVLFSFLATATSSGLSFFYVLRNFNESVQVNLEKDAISYGHELNGILGGIEAATNTLSQTVLGLVDSKQLSTPEYYKVFSKQLEAVADQFDQNKLHITSVYIRFDPKLSYGTAGLFHADINLDGILEHLQPTDLSLYAPTDRQHVGWFYEPMQIGKPLWMSPYYNANIDIVMVSYIVPIIVDGQAIGVVGVDIDFKQLSDIAKKRTEPGKVILLDQNYHFLVHDTYTFEDQLDTIDNGNLKSLQSRLMENKAGIAFYQLQNVKKVLGFSRLNNDWTVVVAQTEEEAFSAMNQIAFFLILLNVATTIAMSVLAWLMARHINTLVSRNSDLEDEVNQRTLQLQETNEYLEETVAELESQQAELTLLNDQLDNSLKQQQAIQEKLIISEKLASMGEIIAGVAHELNTPIGTAITLNSYLDKGVQDVRQKFEAGIIGKQEFKTYLESTSETIGIIHGTLNRIASLVELFKQMIADKTMLDIQKIHIPDFLNTIVTQYKPQLTRGHHQIHVRAEPDLTIVSYPTVIQQILNQLIQNTLIHGFDDLTNRLIEIEVSTNGRQIEINYLDNGHGISENLLARVFNPFFSTRRHKGSAGIGLHIVHNLVTQTLEGTISLESQNEKGVKFTIRFETLNMESD